MRRIVAILAALGLIAAGWYGAWSYGHDYYLYRGFAPPHNPPGVPAGRLVTERFHSPALHGERSYRIYLPHGYSAAASRGVRFPVLYMLHGSPGQPDLFMRAGNLGVALDTLVARHAIQPMIVVMPDGRDGSFRSDTEWANTAKGRYESFVLDAVKAVDSRWATKADRTHRAIAGNSEGAYGAVNIALRHLDTFAVAESWSGYFTQTATGPFKHEPKALVRANSPTSYAGSLAPQLARQRLSILIYGGRKDPVTAQTPAFAAQLRRAGARVTVRTFGGRHDWRLWRAQTPMALSFAARHIGAA
jgi:S-formylglutathione hydrolase FrmB